MRRSLLVLAAVALCLTGCHKKAPTETTYGSTAALARPALLALN